MSQHKSLQELTFKDNFMFGAVLLDPENCKGVIERSIGTEIERVEVSKEKSIVYNPEYKGIRLDAYAKDENKTRYNVEIMDDGAHTIFLSTKGTNEHEVPEDLVKFLKFVGAKPSESEKDFDDAFVQRLQKSIREVKASREMGARYMTFQELLKDEHAEGKEEGRVEVIKILVKNARKYHARDEEIIEQLMTELSVDKSKAKEYLKKAEL